MGDIKADIQIQEPETEMETKDSSTELSEKSDDKMYRRKHIL